MVSNNKPGDMVTMYRENGSEVQVTRKLVPLFEGQGFTTEKPKASTSKTITTSKKGDD